jgi:hypothetical protein
MDPMEKITLDAPGFAYEGRKCSPGKLWAPTGAGPFLAAHLKSPSGIHGRGAESRTEPNQD